MRESKYCINLSNQERVRLNTVISQSRHSDQKVARARVLIQADNGKSDSEIAELVGCSRSTVWRTRRKFCEYGRIESIERNLTDKI
jgi:transposase-like protein